MDYTPVLYQGFTPLHLAVLSEGNDDKIKALLDQGASPAARTPHGDTPLHLTIISDRYRMEFRGKPLVDDRLFLIEENPFGINGLSHCHIACLFGKLKIVRKFLDRGINPNMHRIHGTFRMKPDEHIWHGNTCLHLATYGCHFEVVQLLLERGADPNACNASLCTPLHIPPADNYGGSFITKLLLDRGADVNALNCDYMTPLHVQFSSPLLYWDCSTVKALLQAGANVNLINRFGLTAVHTAVTAYQDDIESDYDLSFDTLTLLSEHVVSLREAGFDLSNENLKTILYLKEEFCDMRWHKKICKKELKRMDDVRLDARTTLREVLCIHDPRRLQQLAVVFERIIIEKKKKKNKMKKKAFPIYGHLVQLQYRRGARITEAVLALQKLYAYMVEDNNGLPYECAEMVVYYLSYEELWRVIRAASQ